MVTWMAKPDHRPYVLQKKKQKNKLEKKNPNRPVCPKCECRDFFLNRQMNFEGFLLTCIPCCKLKCECHC